MKKENLVPLPCPYHATGPTPSSPFQVSLLDDADVFSVSVVKMRRSLLKE